MITSNVCHRVFQCKFGDSTATMFAVDVDKKQYLITARHVICGVADVNEGEIFFRGHWMNAGLSIVGQSTEADIAVLTSNCRVSPAHPMEASPYEINWGQDVFFLGFPYGWRAMANGDLNRGFAMPFVKKAIISAMNSDNGYPQLLLDGHNNPGFSGGPVVFKPYGSNEFKVTAIVSAYRYQELPIYEGQVEVPLLYRYNTGIIVADSISIALDLIKANPIGFPIN